MNWIISSKSFFNESDYSSKREVFHILTLMVTQMVYIPGSLGLLPLIGRELILESWAAEFDSRLPSVGVPCNDVITPASCTDTMEALLILSLLQLTMPGEQVPLEMEEDTGRPSIMGFTIDTGLPSFCLLLMDRGWGMTRLLAPDESLKAAPMLLVTTSCFSISCIETFRPFFSSFFRSFFWAKQAIQYSGKLACTVQQKVKF